MQKGREEAHGYLLERNFLGDEDMEEGVVLVLEVQELREYFLVCSCLDQGPGEEELGGEQERFLVCTSLEQSLAQEGIGTEVVLAPGAGLRFSITCTVQKIATRSLVWGERRQGKPHLWEQWWKALQERSLPLLWKVLPVQWKAPPVQQESPMSAEQGRVLRQ